MINTQKVAEDILWIGASDRRISRFENLFPLTNGVSYNSYLLFDEKTVLFDTADSTVAGQFFENLTASMEGRKLDYLVILHMEPDHCAQIARVVSLFPDVTLAGSMKALQFAEQFFPELKNVPREVLKEGSILNTGKHNISFVAAPMVHWPEVLLAYDDVNKAVFSADAFGTWGAVDGSIFADEHDYEKEYLDDSRRYYANIVGKYGPQVQGVLKKAAKLDIQMMVPYGARIWAICWISTRSGPPIHLRRKISPSFTVRCTAIPPVRPWLLPLPSGRRPARPSMYSMCQKQMYLT